MKNITIALVLMASPVMAQESIRLYPSPSVAVTGGTFTGPVAISDDEFSVGGSTFVVTGGKVGVGNANPTPRFLADAPKTDNAITWANAAACFGDQAFSNLLCTRGMESPPYGMILQGLDSAVAKFPLLLNPSGGSVGIGTTSPASKLQIGTSLNGTTDYMQIDTLAADTAGPPAATDCDAATEVGRMVVSSRYTATADNNLWICMQTAASTYAWWKTAITAP